MGAGRSAVGQVEAIVGEATAATAVYTDRTTRVTRRVAAALASRHFTARSSPRRLATPVVRAGGEFSKQRRTPCLGC